jgi:Zn-dependent metalloprotease
MIRSAAVSLLVLVLFGFPPASAAPPSKSERQAAIERLRAASGQRLEVRWSEDRTTLRTLAGRLSAPRAGTPEEVARVFLEEQRELFGFDADLTGLSLRGVRSSPGGAHVGFGQVYRGLRVFDGGLDVHVDSSGSVYLVQSAYAEALDLPTAPRISSAAATAAALRRFGVAALAATDKRGQPLLQGGLARKARATGRPELGIFPSETGPALVYRVELYSAAPLALVEFFVSAADGSILLSRNLVQSAVDGQGRVFDPNPVVTMNDTTLTDHDDADDPSFAGAYTDVTLPQVKRLLSDRLGPYTLMGPYVRIADLIEPPYNMAVTSPDGRFQFTRDAQGFEAVMAYFHLDRNQRYIQSLGFLDVNNRAVSADPHGVFGMDNSHYVPLPFGAGWVAFGEGGVDDAEDADVLLHEYGHAIQDNQNPGRFLPFRETGAMGEGFGDYWAFSNSPQTGFDPACIGEWDFQGTCLRRVDGTKHYPEDLAGEVHADGEIWSSALHGVFEALGKETADRTILESHFLVPPRPGFCDGALALEQAANNLYGPEVKSAVGQAAAARGIAGDFAFQPGVATSNGQPLRFTIVNRGPCSLGPTRHAVFLTGQGAPVLQGFVETSDLAPGQAVDLEFDLPSAVSPQDYLVQADYDDAEAETSETNNSLFVFVPVGTPPTIASVDALARSGEAICDETTVLQGLLCTNGITTDLVAAPFPTETVTVRYTEATLRARVTDPDSTPAESDILEVTVIPNPPPPNQPHGRPGSFLQLLDDGGAITTVSFDAGRPEDCTVDPVAGICDCRPAVYPVSTQDAVAGDDVYTRVMPLVWLVPPPPQIPGGPIPNAATLQANCIARSRGLMPVRVDVTGGVLPWEIDVRDKGGHIVRWPQNPQVGVDPTTLTCDGDACGCCLLLSDNPSASPANGGCAGLPGLVGIAGSGFENGFCVTLFPSGLRSGE